MGFKKKNMEIKKIEIEKLNQALSNYHKNGWVVIKNFFSKNDAKNIEKQISNILKNNYKHYDGRDINFINDTKKFSDINSFHRLHDFKFIKKLSKENKIKKIIKLFLNTKNLELRASELFAKPKRYGLRVPIHQDNFYWNVIGGNALTIWIALSSSSKKNGGMFYFNKSHLRGIFPHKSSYAKGSSQTIKYTKSLKKFKKVYPKLNVGDALIHSCLVVHGSNKNKSDLPRKGLTFQFKSKNSSYDLAKIKKYEKKLQEQIKLRSM
jgi:ectoine hydroxylase-related dioxygenase (phytanoyl-CoA dioxygenase family)